VVLIINPMGTQSWYVDKVWRNNLESVPPYLQSAVSSSNLRGNLYQQKVQSWCDFHPLTTGCLWRTSTSVLWLSTQSGWSSFSFRNPPSPMRMVRVYFHTSILISQWNRDRTPTLLVTLVTESELEFSKKRCEFICRVRGYISDIHMYTQMYILSETM